MAKCETEPTLVTPCRLIEFGGIVYLISTGPIMNPVAIGEIQ